MDLSLSTKAQAESSDRSAVPVSRQNRWKENRFIPVTYTVWKENQQKDAKNRRIREKNKKKFAFPFFHTTLSPSQ